MSDNKKAHTPRDHKQDLSKEEEVSALPPMTKTIEIFKEDGGWSSEDWHVDQLSRAQIDQLSKGDSICLPELSKGRKGDSTRSERLIQAHFIAAYYGQPGLSRALREATGVRCWTWEVSEGLLSTDRCSVPSPITGEIVDFYDSTPHTAFRETWSDEHLLELPAQLKEYDPELPQAAVNIIEELIENKQTTELDGLLNSDAGQSVLALACAFGTIPTQSNLYLTKSWSAFIPKASELYSITIVDDDPEGGMGASCSVTDTHHFHEDPSNFIDGMAQHLKQMATIIDRLDQLRQ